MAYKSFHNQSASAGQREIIEALQDQLSKQTTPLEHPDGLWLVSADEAELETPTGRGFGLVVPDSIKQWLRDIALLRGIPMAYLVPDPKLLPPESIRFFHVDRSWTDRVIDGALSAANVGTLDMTFRMQTMIGIRDAVNEELNKIVRYEHEDDITKEDPYIAYKWDARHEPQAPISGMLIRSELVRRWPELEVFAYDRTVAGTEQPDESTRVRLLRRDLLTRDIMIVLFAGIPARVELKEPRVGIRFGIEGEARDVEVNLRNHPGEYATTKEQVEGKTVEVATMVTVPLEPASRWWPGSPMRVISGVGLENEIDKLLGDVDGIARQPEGTAVGSRGVGLCLEQLPYVQIFQPGDEQLGSEHFPEDEEGVARGPALTRRGALVLRTMTSETDQ